MKRDRIADRAVEPFKLGNGFGGNAGERVTAVEHDQNATAASLLSAERREHIGAPRFGPVGARFGQAAGGDRSDADVGAHHEQLIIARRHRELGVGILAGLDASPDEKRGRGGQSNGQMAHHAPSSNLTDAERCRVILKKASVSAY